MGVATGNGKNEEENGMVGLERCKLMLKN